MSCASLVCCAIGLTFACISVDRSLPGLLVLLDGEEFDERDNLIRQGEQRYGQYYQILTDKKHSNEIKIIVFGFLSDMTGDRTMFLLPALDALSDSDPGVRQRATGLLAEIGDRRHCDPVAKLLSDRDLTVVFAAARALSRIGGPPEVQVLEEWVAVGSRRSTAMPPKEVEHLRPRIAKFRQELVERLAREERK